jgi:hypothetical protein
VVEADGINLVVDIETSDNASQVMITSGYRIDLPFDVGTVLLHDDIDKVIDSDCQKLARLMQRCTHCLYTPFSSRTSTSQFRIL